MTADNRWNANQPDRMESHPIHRLVATPLCTLQELDPEDFRHTIREALDEEEKRIALHTDPETCRLNEAFVRAHGVPRGEYTIFVTPAVAAGDTQRR